MPSTAPVKINIRGVDEFTKEFKRAIKGAGRLGKKISSVGKTMTATITAPLLALGGAGIKFSNDLNAAMANVGTLIPEQGKRLKNFKNDVLDLGDAFGITDPTIVAEGLYETISAFGSATTPINKLTTATKMSKAGLSSVKEALSLVSAVTKGYGDVSDEAAAKVSDLSFLTVKLGQTTFPDLAESIGNVIPFATTLKVSQEELFGSFATLTGVTGNASEVATQLRSALGAFLTPSAAMTTAVKKLGYESSVAMIKEKGLKGSLDELQKATGGNEIKLGKLITRKEGLNAALTLLGPQYKNFISKTKQMGKATGATDKALKEQTHGINATGFAMDQMLARLKRLSIQIGDKLSPVLMKLMDRIDPIIESTSKLSSEQLGLGIKIAAVVAAVGPLLAIFGKLISIGAAVVGAVGSAGGVGAVMAAVTGPIGMAIAAVAALTAGFIYFRDEVEPITASILTPLVDTFTNLNEAVSFTDGSFGNFLESLKPVVGILSELYSPVVRLGVKLLLLPLNLIIKGFKLTTTVLGYVSDALSIVLKGVRFVWVWLGKLWTSFTEGTVVGEYLKKAFDWIADSVSYVWKKVSGFFGALSDGFASVKSFLKDTGIAIDDATQSMLPQQLKIQADAGLAPLSDAAILDAITMGKAESSFNITFEGLPEGVTANVTEARGGNVKVKARGHTMDGSL